MIKSKNKVKSDNVNLFFLKK